MLAPVVFALPYFEVIGSSLNPTLFAFSGGGGLSLRLTNPSFIQELSLQYRVVVSDPCQVGKSTCPIADTFQEMIDDNLHIVDYVKKLYNITAFYVMGYSSGCIIANVVSEKYAEYITAMVWIAPFVDFRDVTDSTRKCVHDRLSLPYFVIDTLPLSVYVTLRTLLCGFSCVQHRNLISIGSCKFDSQMPLSDYMDYIAVRRNIDKTYTMLRLPESINITFPLTIILGAFDRIAPIAPVYAYLPNIMSPHLDVYLVADASHGLIYEQPDELLKYITAMK